MRRLLNLTDAELQTAVRWHIKRASGAKGTENPDMKRPI